MPTENNFKFKYEIPENMGMSSACIVSFVKAVSENTAGLRGVMLMCHGKIAAEGYFKPFDYKSKHKKYTMREAAKSILFYDGTTEDFTVFKTDNGNLLFSYDGIFAVCIPSADIVFVCMLSNPLSETVKQDILKKLICDVAQKVEAETISLDMEAYDALLAYLSELDLPLPEGENKSETENIAFGKRYSFAENIEGVDWIKPSWGDKMGVLRYKDKNGENEFYFGRGEYRSGKFSMFDAEGFAAGIWKNPDEFYIKIEFTGARVGDAEIAMLFEENKIKLAIKSEALGLKTEFEGASGGEKQ